MPSGVGALDARTGGLVRGGLHLLAGPPLTERTVLLARFLAAGLERGERVGLVGRRPPGEWFREVEPFVPGLEEAWRAGRLTVVGFGSGREERIRRAGRPEEVFAELGEILTPAPERIALDPSEPLWNGASAMVAAEAFVAWSASTGATLLAALGGSLTGSVPPALERVFGAAAGALELRPAEGDGILLTVRKAPGGARASRSLRLRLQAGVGLEPASHPREKGGRGGPDAPSPRVIRWRTAAEGGGLPGCVTDWLERRCRVTDVGDEMELLERLQGPARLDQVVIVADRTAVPLVERTVRVAARAADVPIHVLSGTRLRASDRARLLEAGAADCLSGTVDVRELASRMGLPLEDPAVGKDRPGAPVTRTTGVQGDRPAGGPGADEPSPTGPSVAGAPEHGAPPSGNGRGEDDLSMLVGKLRQLLERETLPFSLVRLPCERSARERLVTLLRSEVRGEEGDVVAALGGGCSVLLPVSTTEQAEGFLARVRPHVEREVGPEPLRGAEVLDRSGTRSLLNELTAEDR